MTERKPPGVSFESWVDRQIREARDRGEFDNLPGAGKPIAGLDRPYDELWWVKGMMQRENLEFTPPTLKVRKEVEDTLASLATFPSEQAVRDAVEVLNVKIRDMNRKPGDGPPTTLMPLDVDRVLARWRSARADT